MTTIEKLKQFGVKKGAKVKGLFVQSVYSAYQDEFSEPETITSIVTHPEDSDYVIIKTKELTARKTLDTVNGEVELKAENKQYVLTSSSLLEVFDGTARIEDVRLKYYDTETKEMKDLKVQKSKYGIETDFTIVKPEFFKKLKPLINYIKHNKKELDDIMELDSVKLVIEDVEYDMEALSKLAYLSE